MASTPETIGSIDALSEEVWRDQRVFTEKERELLAGVLERATHRDGPGAGEHHALAVTVATAVGEAIARRLLERAGADTASNLLARDGSTAEDQQEAVPEATADVPVEFAGPGPKLGGPGPKSSGPGPKMSGPGPKMSGPGPKMEVSRLEMRGPGGPKGVADESRRGPGGPKRKGPGGPKRGPGGPKRRGPGGPKGRESRHYRAAHVESHTHGGQSFALPGSGSVLVLDEFLAPQELERLARFVADHESDFVLSEVVAPGATATGVDFEQRKSRVLYDLDEQEAVVSGRILAYLPRILPAIGLEPFPIAQVEAQITASNDGDFFRPHEDNGAPPLRTRELTFVYFFHREPRAFRGGELRIYEREQDGVGRARDAAVRAIVPKQNQLVLFPSHLVHEITPVQCASRKFRDSRFTLNGWFHRPE